MGMDRKALEEWSNEEIRQALLDNGQKDVPITPTTRLTLVSKLRKLLHSKQDAPEEAHDQAPEEERNETSAAQVTPVEKRENGGPFEGYYGIAASGLEKGTALQLSPYYTSKAEVLKAIKSLPGARFKKFESQERAEAYSQDLLQTGGDANTSSSDLDVSGSPNLPLCSVEKANNFPSLKRPELSAFRKCIESGRIEDFTSSIWSNPRYIISPGDTPVILQIPSHYNALHCAVLARKLDICCELFDILESERFWKLVYPDDSDDTREKRRSHLKDLYLNMQDKLKYETPLHFASRLGYEEIVAFFMALPGVSTDVKNKDQLTPAEVACRNAKIPRTGLKERIQNLIKAPKVYYVPVFRAADNSIPPQLGSPCTGQEYAQSLGTHDRGSPILGQAFAGPMSPSKAREFFREWKSPSKARERNEASRMKRSDPNKGWERVGRRIAASQDVGWTEYWGFLGCYCDLSTADGLQKLEEYLVDLCPSPHQCQTLDADEDLPTNTLDSEEPLTSNLEMNGLTDDFGSLDISTEHYQSSEYPTDQLQPSPSPSRVGGCADSFVTPVRNTRNQTTPIYLAGSRPTMLDYDVLMALSHVHVDVTVFSHVKRWLQLVESYTEVEQKSWCTPTPHHRHQNFITTTHTIPVSPLVFSSPTHSPIPRAIHHTTPQRPHPSNYPRISSLTMESL